MRIKSHWFKTDRDKTVEEVAGALAFTLWRIADNALKNTRKADFEIAVGLQYFAFLSEFLIFLIQVGDRIAYRELPVEQRLAFTGKLANRVAENLAENQCNLIGGLYTEHKQQFIDALNRRAAEYAEYNYDRNGPEYGFIRFFAYCMRDVVDEKDAEWIVDQVISIEAPQAVELVEGTLRDLFELEPRQPRARTAISGE